MKVKTTRKKKEKPSPEVLKFSEGLEFAFKNSKMFNFVLESLLVIEQQLEEVKQTKEFYETEQKKAEKRDNLYSETVRVNVGRLDYLEKRLDKLYSEFSLTNPDNADEATDDIYIWYKGDGFEDVIGQIDPWNYLIKIPGGSPGTVTIQMCVYVGNTVEPGFYMFQSFIEPTNWEEVKTVNMG